MKLKHWFCFILLVAAMAFSSGCATSALWQEGQFARFHEPARPPNLHLFYSAHRASVLVQYDESNEGNESIRQRAYWLKPGHDPEKNLGKPRFVSVDAAQDLSPIPVVDSPATAPPGIPGYYAVAGTKDSGFSLRSGEQTVGSYELPVYKDASGRTKQVLLTPLTVVADLTIIGGVTVVLCWPAGATISL